LPAVLVRGFLSGVLADLGEFREAIALVEEAVRLAEVSGQPFSLGLAYSAAGIVYVTQGGWRAAIRLLEKGLVICEERQIAHQFPYFAWPLGRAYAAQGRIAEGIRLLQQAVERAEAMHLWERQALRVTCLGEAHALAGRADEALIHARRALVLAREHQDPGSEVWALRLLGEVAAQADPPDAVEAEAHYRQARALAEGLGMRPLVAHCHLGLGTLYPKIGHDEQARAEVTVAVAMYRAMEMTFWLAKAEAALVQVAS
jgi:tetratricopeptide (TPR) repeat protein